MIEEKMEELVRIQANINIETKKLSAHQIQAVLINAKRHKTTEEHVEYWNTILETLMKHLERGLTKMDDQLLCATCFFSVLTLTNKQEFYLLKLKDTIDIEISFRSQGIKEALNTLQVVSMIYGMFQSSYLLTKDTNKEITLELLSSSLKLLVLMGYEYSQYTFTVFKTLSSFKKIVGTDYQETIFCLENQISLLNLVNHNWENPITGVRDLNRLIFQILIANIDEQMLQRIMAEINSFYWNKAKYLMLTVVIENHNGNITKLLNENNWVKGLIDNLHKPGLISAVTDMYFAVLEKLQSVEQWCEIFLPSILQILNGTCSRAIEHFINYWLLITLKKFSQLLDILIGNLLEFDDTEHRLHSILCLVKQGHKIGTPSKLLEDNSRIENMLLCGIEHCNTQIRMLAFDILCIPKKTMPTDSQYKLILNYLQNNINSDCTVLRISMLKSFDTFMGELHIQLRQLREIEGKETDQLVNYCKEIQKLFVYSLNSDGNYQRKITTIKMCNSFLACVSEIPKKRRQQTRDSNVILIDFLKDRNSWILFEGPFLIKLISLLKDPSDDVRDNVTSMLLLHYNSDLRKSTLDNAYFASIVEDALKCMKSKFFYEVSCGQSMFHLIVNILLKGNRADSMFKSVDDIFKFGYNELKTEYKLKRNITKTIEEGKQLHSFISILQVVLEASLNAKKMIQIPNDTMDDLLGMLEDIANQFSWEQSNSALSDFSEMSVMVENIIEKSGHKSSEKDETKISGMHQMVLNCLWHNVKTSCQLASLLIQYNADDVERSSKCLMITTRVLETSRHKGAIEAAGVALGKAIQYLTSLPEESKTSSLPQTLLKMKLQMLISEASKMASITRRGAGLSIMVHRIVSSDMRKGKPLFHYFMKTILETCQKTDDIPSSQDVANIENQVDLPKAILIHFLTKIVTDSSLASDMMFYSAELAQLAFSNLISPHWQIRNAALQLYGALVQKLVGQKKASGTDDETIATVACDELRTHSPKLWSYITIQLKNNSQGNKIETHSNLIPILNMLANSAKRYNFSFDLEEQKASDKELLHSLVTILDSPIHTVRRLTAKCIFNIFPFQSIQYVFIHMSFKSENLLHGALMLFRFCCQYHHYQHEFSQEIKHTEEMFRDLLKIRKHSYWSRKVFESTVCNKNTMDLDNILSEANSNTDAFGKPIWLKTFIRNCIHNSSWEMIPQYLQTLLKQIDYESYCEFLVEKLNDDCQVPAEVLRKVADTALNFKNKYNSSALWKILYQISLRVELVDVDIEELIRELKGGIPYKLRYIIPFAARVILNTNANEQQLLDLQNWIFELSDSETADFNMRYIAVLANNEMANHFDNLSDAVKMVSIETAVFLLQDEDEDVRNASVNYYKNIKHLENAVHSNICLHKILDRNFLLEVLSQPKMINILCDNILSFVSADLHSIDRDNPFANDSKNIYLEVNVLSGLVENLKCQ